MTTIELSKSDKYSELAFSTMVSIVTILTENQQDENLEIFIKTRLNLPELQELHEALLSSIVTLLDQELVIHKNMVTLLGWP
jgi:hypothetical protein